MALIPGSGRSLGVGNGNPLQYSSLANPMDRGTWQVTYSPWGHRQSDTSYWLNSTTLHLKQNEVWRKCSWENCRTASIRERAEVYQSGWLITLLDWLMLHISDGSVPMTQWQLINILHIPPGWKGEGMWKKGKISLRLFELGAFRRQWNSWRSPTSILGQHQRFWEGLTTESYPSQ